MKIFLASDHGGFELKKELVKYLGTQGYRVNDLGPYQLDPQDDYPDFVLPVTRKVAQENDSFGILICRSGIGMSVMANKAKGIRAGLCTYPSQAQQAREHADCNVLVLDADYSKREEATKIVDHFLKTAFSQGERHIRRIDKIKKFEDSDYSGR